MLKLGGVPGSNCLDCIASRFWFPEKNSKRGGCLFYVFVPDDAVPAVILDQDSRLALFPALLCVLEFMTAKEPKIFRCSLRWQKIEDRINVEEVTWALRHTGTKGRTSNEAI